jgi:hypothetical protein
MESLDYIFDKPMSFRDAKCAYMETPENRNDPSGPIEIEVLPPNSATLPHSGAGAGDSMGETARFCYCHFHRHYCRCRMVF